MATEIVPPELEASAKEGEIEAASPPILTERQGGLHLDRATLLRFVPLLILLPASGMAYLCTFTVLVLLFGLLTPEEKAAMKRSLYVWNRRSAESRREAGI